MKDNARRKIFKNNKNIRLCEKETLLNSEYCILLKVRIL